LGSSNGRFGVLKLPSPGRQGPAVLSALAPSRRVTAATPLCRPAMCRAGHGLDGNIFRAQQHERLSRSGSFQRPTRPPVERGGRRPRWRAPGAVGALDARASHCQRPAAWPAWTPSG